MRTPLETLRASNETGDPRPDAVWSLDDTLRANSAQLTLEQVEDLIGFFEVDAPEPITVRGLEKGLDSYNPYVQWIKIHPDDSELTEVFAMRTEPRDGHLSENRFCIRATDEEVVTFPGPYQNITNETLEAIATLDESNRESDANLHVDLRTAVRDILQTAELPDAFIRVYDMNSLELREFVKNAQSEINGRSGVQLIELDDIKRLDLEDLSMSVLPDGGLFVTGVYVNWDKDDPNKALSWHTEYYRGTSLATLEYIGRSQDGEKDHRLGILKYANEEVGDNDESITATRRELVLVVRPRGETHFEQNGVMVTQDHEEGKLGYVILPDIECLQSPGHEGVPKEQWRELDRKTPQNSAKILENMRYIAGNGVYKRGTWGEIGGLTDIGDGWFLASLHTAS